jgi:hypothetical protein
MQVSGPAGPLIRVRGGSTFARGPRLGRGSFAIRRVEGVRDGRTRFGEQVAVAIARDADRRVPEVGLHLLEVPARGDEQRRARVAEIVEAAPRSSAASTAGVYWRLRKL